MTSLQRVPERSDDHFHQGRVLLSKVGLNVGDELLDVAADPSRDIDLTSHPERAFDVVLWNGALQRVDDRLAALEQTRRLLREGGRVGVAATAREREHDWDRALRVVLARLGVTQTEKLAHGAHPSVSTDEVLSWLWEAGFVDIALQIRSFGDSFDHPGEIVARYLNGACGSPFRELDTSLRERVKRELEAELERQRTAQGIRLERHVIFAVGRAQKPTVPRG